MEVLVAVVVVDLLLLHNQKIKNKKTKTRKRHLRVVLQVTLIVHHDYYILVLKSRKLNHINMQQLAFKLLELATDI